MDAAPQLIALYSPVMQSGKSTIADVLVAERGYERVKFAGPMKAMIKAFLVAGGAPEDLAEEMLEGNLKDRIIPGLGVSTRRLLQTIGTEWGQRIISPSLWVNMAMAAAARAGRQGKSVVIDDLRFPQEYEAVLMAGGYPVRVYREGTEPYAEHPSEGLLEGYPFYLVENNAGLSEIKACALQLPELLDRAAARTRA